MLSSRGGSHGPGHRPQPRRRRDRSHRRRAKARGVSLEQELRDVLSRAAKPSKEELLREMREIAALTPELPPGQQRTPAEILIRESRDSR
jgi:plasmid stability protein